MKKKDDLYYIRRLQKAQEERHAPMSERLEAMIGNLDTEEKNKEFYDLLDQLNADSSIARSERIGVHLNEAFAIIRAMLEEPTPTGSSRTYEIFWVDRLSNLDGKGKLMQSNLTRAEMLDRLHWISSEEFGEDVEEWSDWMAAFEENPPAWGHR